MQSRKLLVVASGLAVVFVSALGLLLWMLANETYTNYPQLSFGWLFTPLIGTIPLPTVAAAAMVFWFAIDSKKYQDARFGSLTLQRVINLVYLQAVWVFAVVAVVMVTEDVGHILLVVGVFTSVAICLTVGLFLSAIRGLWLQNSLEKETKPSETWRSLGLLP